MTAATGLKGRVARSLVMLAIGTAVNIVLSSVKLYVGLSVNSLTVTLDATNNFFDILTCLVTIGCFAAILLKRTNKAPYGYGRCEYLASFIVAAVAAVLGGVFMMRSLNRLAMPEPVWFGYSSLAVVIAAIPIKLALGVAYLLVNKKIRSKAISALTLDSFLDVGVSTASLISFAASGIGGVYSVDAAFGIALSIFVIVVAIKMVVDGVRAVVIGDGSQEEKEQIAKFFEAHGELTLLSQQLHDYGYGCKTGFVQASADFPADGERAKRLAEEFERAIADSTGACVKLFLTSKGDGQNEASKGDGAEQRADGTQNAEQQ